MITCDTKLTVICGHSGSGKSTQAKELQSKQPRTAILHSDDYYHCYTPGQDVTQFLIDVAICMQRHGMNVIVDAVNLHPLDYGRWCTAAKHFTSFEWLRMTTPIGVCIERDSRRSYPVGEEAIRSQGEIEWVSPLDNRC